MMFHPKGIAALSLMLILSGCAAPQTVSRVELEKMKGEWKEPKVSSWYYTGSKEGYHYFHHDDLGDGRKDVRISEAELDWPDPFPRTRQRKYWRPLDWGVAGLMKRFRETRQAPGSLAPEPSTQR
jgi:hypothetical protein